MIGRVDSIDTHKDKPNDTSTSLNDDVQRKFAAEHDASASGPRASGGSKISKIIELAEVGATSAMYSGIQSPLKGLAQLADHAIGTNIEHKIDFMNKPKDAVFGSEEWHAQTIGSGIGAALPYWLMSKASRLGVSKIGLAALKEDGAAAATTKKLIEGTVTGFSSDFLTRPADFNSSESANKPSDFWHERLIAGISGAANMTTMAGTNLLFGQRFGKGFVGRFAAGTLSGIPAGLVSTESTSLLEHKGLVGKDELAQSMYSTALTGGVLGAFHALPRRNLESPLAQNFAPDSAASPPRLVSEALAVPTESIRPRSLEASTPRLSDAEQLPASTAAKLPRPMRAPVSSPEASSKAPSNAPLRIISEEEIDSMADFIKRTTYSDGTIKSHYTTSDITVTEHPDGSETRVDRNGTTVDRPDGSSTRTDGFRSTEHDAQGNRTITDTRWLHAFENWESLGGEQKLDILNNLKDIPHGGNATGLLLEKGLFYEDDPRVQATAARNVHQIKDAHSQVDVWNLALEQKPELHSILFDQLDTLKENVRDKVLANSYTASAFIDHTANKYEMTGSTPEGAKAQAVDDYLHAVSDLSESSRKQVFDALALKQKHYYGNSNFDPNVDAVASRVLDLYYHADPLVDKAFGEFWHEAEAFNDPIKRISNTKVERDDADFVQETGARKAVRKFSKLFDDALQKDNDLERWDALQQARIEGRQMLENNPSVDFQRGVYGWAETHPDAQVRSFMEEQFKPVQRLIRLDQNLRDQIHGMNDLENFDKVKAFQAIHELTERAPRQKISDEQLIATKQNILQLFQIADLYRDQTGQLTRVGKDFQRAAMQTLNQAADPLLVTQGRHGTCAIASLEMCLFMKNPDEASRLVNEVLRTGKIVTTDGTTIEIDAQSLKPQPNSLNANQGKIESKHDGTYRSYASQIIQTTLANVYWQRQTEHPGAFGQGLPGEMKYRLREKDVLDQSGQKVGVEPAEEVYWQRGNGPEVVLSDGPYIMTHQEIVYMGRQIGGERTVPSIIDRRDPILGDEAKFQQHIASLKYPEQFPVIISIDGRAIDAPVPTWLVESNHSVSILAPWQIGGNIFYHNTWHSGDIVTNYMPKERFIKIAPPIHWRMDEFNALP